MSFSDLDNIDEASSLTSSDLNGLLKAARLTKYVSDSDNTSAPTPVTFEKSANLFDLVRSKIEKPDALTEFDEAQDLQPEAAIGNSEGKLETEKLEVADVNNADEMLDTKELEGIVFFDADPSTDLTLLKDNLVEEISEDLSDVGGSEKTLAPDLDTEIESTNLGAKAVGDEIPKKSYDDGYVAAKLEFEQLLKVEKERFQNLSEALFSVSQTIVGATEEKLKTFILETTSKLLGEKIEELPEKYVTKISGIINELSTKTDEITVTLNKEDLAAIKKVKTFKDFLYSFAADEALMRGEFKIKSGKLTSEVKLYENSINEIEPNEL